METEKEVIAAVVTGVALILNSFITVHYGEHRARRRYPDKHASLDKAMDAAVSVLRDANRKNVPITAANLVRDLRSEHSLNYVVAGLYVLNELEVIRWEDNNILKPEHDVRLVIR